MSIDALALILENAYACKIDSLPYGKVIRFQAHKGGNWKQIEIDSMVYATLYSRYKNVVEKWEAGLDEQS
jgi:hypothetical protein